MVTVWEAPSRKVPHEAKRMENRVGSNKRRKEAGLRGNILGDT